MKRSRMMMFIGIASILMLLVISSPAERPKGNGVIVAGNMWGTYKTGNITEFGHQFRDHDYIEDFKRRGDDVKGNFIFAQSRFVTSGLFGNPAISWPFGKVVADTWGGYLSATVHDTRPEFAAKNANNYEAPPVDARDLNYSFLRYGSSIPGAGDPSRDFINPGPKNASGGGAFFTDGRKAMAMFEAGWPTNVGVDIKMKVYSPTTPWGSLDDMHLVEVEFYNTGIQDLDNDGTVDFTNAKINGLALTYQGEAWFMAMRPAGNRGYNTGGYRPAIHDATPDENGHPWAITSYSNGERGGTGGFPGVGNQSPMNGQYNDVSYGYTFVGAKSVDDNGNILGNKMLAFKDASGNQPVHPIGEGARRGWFMSNSNTTGTGGTLSARNLHINAVGQFYLDGGRGYSFSNLDLNPNPSIFESGGVEDLTSFVVKSDPATWLLPDGADEYADPVFDFQGISIPQGNPISAKGIGNPVHIDQIHEGIIQENSFNDVAQAGFGPFDLEVGERMRVYFVRGYGFRQKGLREAVKAARAMVEALQPDGTFLDTGVPAVPEIKITGSANVKPLVMFAPVDGADGYKVYRSNAFPLYDTSVDGFMYESVYWKTMTPGRDNRPAADPVNPRLTEKTILREKNGEHWGPYVLIKDIPTANLASFTNPRSQDAGSYPYAYEDNEDTFTLPGQTFYYYVAAYKNTTPPAPYAALESGVSWIESGKVNVNGRNGLWQNTWPYTDRYAFYPAATDAAALKSIGAKFELLSPTVAEVDLELDRANIVVRPNPYKRLAFHDVGTESKILFANLPAQCTITILDMSGQIVDRIDFTAPTPDNGTFFWKMFSKNGVRVASGVYIWVVEHDRGVEKGVLSILR